MQVDYSKIAVSNEYFALEKAELDSATNQLNVTLRWKSQSQALNPEVSNSVCILSGIELTPKQSAAWDSKDRLSVVTSGEVVFDVRFTGGAGFTAFNRGIYDEYALVRSLKNGWIFENGG